MAEGPTARWWQEQEPPSETSRQASERVARAAAPVAEAELELDTWTELEAEAARRSQQASASDTETVSIPIDRSAALRQDNRDRIFIFAFLALNLILGAAFCLVTIPQHGELRAVNIFFCLSMAAFVFKQVLGLFSHAKRRSEFLQNSEEPAVRLSPQGIHLAAPEHGNVMLPWEEIASISTKRFGKYGRLEIEDSHKRRFLIEEHYLPITAEMLAAQIADYKTARQIA